MGEPDVGSHRPTPDEVVQRVREIVEDIPPGCTMSYGAIGEVLGLGARHVGRVLSRESAGWPWWRVTRADGTLPEPLRARALGRYLSEGTPLHDDHADPRRSRWSPWSP